MQQLFLDKENKGEEAEHIIVSLLSLVRATGPLIDNKGKV